MAKEKQSRKGRPLYILDLHINAELKKFLEYNLEDPSDQSLNSIFAQQQSVSFPIHCTNLKKAVSILSYISGNLFFKGHPITFQLPSYEKIRDDVNNKDGHRFKVLAKVDTPLPKITLNIDYISSGFSISYDATISFQIERKYVV